VPCRWSAGVATGERPALVGELGSQLNGMSCEYLIDTERRLVISRGTGTFRYADFLEHMKTLGADPRFRPDFAHLVDCRKLEQIDMTPAQVQDTGSQSLFAAGSRRAFVVVSDLHFGLGRMFATYREVECDQTTVVFRDIREASIWLGLPKDYDPDTLGEPTRVAGN